MAERRSRFSAWWLFVGLVVGFVLGGLTVAFLPMFWAPPGEELRMEEVAPDLVEEPPPPPPVVQDDSEEERAERERRAAEVRERADVGTANWPDVDGGE